MAEDMTYNRPPRQVRRHRYDRWEAIADRDRAREIAATLEQQLAEALDLITEMRPYVPDYFAEKWEFDERINRLVDPDADNGATDDPA